MTVNKRCSKCKEYKSFKDFSGQKRAKDGKQSYCRNCSSIYSNVYHLTERGRETRKAYAQTKDHKASRRAYRQSEKGKGIIATYDQKETTKAQHRRKKERQRRLYPEKIKAQNAINSAIKRGDLTRPDLCSDCKQPNGKIEGHHPDYSKPLEVIWLCRDCHVNEHINFPQGR